MSFGITDKTWPLDDEGLTDFHPVTIRAEKPGTLEQLTAKGINFRPIETESGTVVAGLVTEGDLERLWEELVLSFSDNGLWPVGVAADDIDDIVSGEYFASPEEVTTNAAAFLRENNPSLTDLAAPLFDGTSPSIVPLPTEPGGGILVVPCTRPADVPATLGWLGPCNYDYDGSDISAVLRSWEERFGAVVMTLGPATLTLQVPNTPTEEAEQEKLAQEHYAFCPDNIDQGAGSIEDYIPAIDSLAWGFWWD